VAVAALLVGSASVASAQEAISNPGRCAQFYPNANCENYGPGNPYRDPASYQSRRDWRSEYAMTYPHRRRHHQYWR
jgi:hypothetical protein